MPPRIDKDLYPFFIVLFLTVVALVIFWSILDMVILGASLAVVLLPLHRRLLRYTRPVLSSAIITICLFALIVGTAWAIMMILQANAGLLNQIFATIGSWLDNPATHPEAFGVPIGRGTLSSWLSEGNSLFVNYWTTITDNLLRIVLKGLIFFISFFLLLLKGQALKDRLFQLLPPPVKNYCDQLLPVAVDTLYVIYIVQIAIAVLTFFIAIPVFYLLGYGDILFYSFLAAFCELIPILGSSVAFIIIGAYALAKNDLYGVFILFFLGYLIVSALPEIYVRPALVGRRVKIHWLIMFVGIIGGILTMGIAGFVLGPLIIVLLIKSYRIWTDDRKGVQGAAERETAREAGP
ncbi:AI-2E family transporter [Methanoregula sp.]|uniref:AI-2E family transporter n=1 Tax=Methanoregula sp. TaxID=2052170 RepID=UPI003562D1E0